MFWVRLNDLFQLYCILLMDAKENKDTENQFLNRVENYIVIGEDDDLKDALLNIYSRWI